MHIPPPVPFTLAWIAQSLIVRKNRDTPVPVLSRAAGAAVGGVSLALMGGTVAQFRLGDTTIDPARPDRSSTLITTGPNRLTRNPIYLGFAGLLVAHALWRGSLTAALPVAGFVAAVTPQIEHEEDALMSRFGRAYARYVGRVPRWVSWR